MFSLRPPTDSLYKFAAILGLILYLSGSVYPFEKWNDLSSQLIDVRAKIDLAKLNPSAENFIEADRLVKQESQAFTAEIIISVICLIIAAAGAVLMIKGFRLWYRRIQVPMDREFLARSKTARSRAAPRLKKLR